MLMCSGLTCVTLSYPSLWTPVGYRCTGPGTSGPAAGPLPETRLKHNEKETESAKKPIREQRGDVREQVSHLVWADLQVRCSPSSESEMASSATSPTSSMDTEKCNVFVFSGIYIFCHKGSLNQNNLTKDVIVWYFEVAWDYGSTTTTTKVYTAN